MVRVVLPHGPELNHIPAHNLVYKARGHQCIGLLRLTTLVPESMVPPPPKRVVYHRCIFYLHHLKADAFVDIPCGSRFSHIRTERHLSRIIPVTCRTHPQTLVTVSDPHVPECRSPASLGPPRLRGLLPCRRLASSSVKKPFFTLPRLMSASQSSCP